MNAQKAETGSIDDSLSKYPGGIEHISLGDVAFCINSVGFRWLSSLLAYLCPLCVP